MAAEHDPNDPTQPTPPPTSPNTGPDRGYVFDSAADVVLSFHAPNYEEFTCVAITDPAELAKFPRTSRRRPPPAE